MEYFSQFIESEAVDEFRKKIQATAVEVVVTFTKGILNLITNDPIESYIGRPMVGELIQSQINGIDYDVPIFLTSQWVGIITNNLDNFIRLVLMK